MPLDKDYGLKFSAYVAAYLVKHDMKTLGRIDRPTLATLAQSFYDENQPPPRATQRPKAEPSDDAAWLVQLAGDPAYLGIDVQREFEKCRVWTQTAKKRNPTRQRFVNWLNRVERPLLSPLATPNGSTHAQLSPYKEPTSEWQGTAIELCAGSALAESIRDGAGWFDLPFAFRQKVLRGL